MNCVFDSTNTVWENYSPDSCLPGKAGYIAKPDFVGWSGIGPIALLIENILGFHVNGVEQTLTWRVTRTDNHGVKHLLVGDIEVDAICQKRNRHGDPLKLSVKTTKKLTLIVMHGDTKKEFQLNAGAHELEVE